MLALICLPNRGNWSCWLMILALLACAPASPLPKPVPLPQTDSLAFLTKSILDYDPSAQNALKDADPEVSPGLWEGDIAGLSADNYYTWRLGLRWDVFPDRRWKNATVPYHISHKYSPFDRQTIQTAIYTLSLMTCVNFIPYDGEAEDYLLIWPVQEPAGCWSFIGRTGGQQVLSLQPPDENGPKCLGGPGKAIHEILHALGIFHEQSRADRDDHVHLFPEHVVSPFLHNFDKQSLKNTTYEFEYDYDSIMHYGTHFFSVARDRPTLVPKRRNARIGQRNGLSRIDCYKVNKLYGCFDRTPYEKLKYESFCDILGL